MDFTWWTLPTRPMVTAGQFVPCHCSAVAIMRLLPPLDIHAPLSHAVVDCSADGTRLCRHSNARAWVGDFGHL
jgi:hypothetical protein